MTVGFSAFAASLKPGLDPDDGPHLEILELN